MWALYVHYVFRQLLLRSTTRLRLDDQYIVQVIINTDIDANKFSRGEWWRGRSVNEPQGYQGSGTALARQEVATCQLAPDSLSMYARPPVILLYIY